MRLLEQAVGIEPNAAEVVHALGLAYIRSGRTAEAISRLERAYTAAARGQPLRLRLRRRPRLAGQDRRGGGGADGRPPRCGRPTARCWWRWPATRPSAGGEATRSGGPRSSWRSGPRTPRRGRCSRRCRDGGRDATARDSADDRHVDQPAEPRAASREPRAAVEPSRARLSPPLRARPPRRRGRPRRPRRAGGDRPPLARPERHLRSPDHGQGRPPRVVRRRPDVRARPAGLHRARRQDVSRGLGRVHASRVHRPPRGGRRSPTRRDPERPAAGADLRASPARATGRATAPTARTCLGPRPRPARRLSPVLWRPTMASWSWTSGTRWRERSR